MNHKAIIPALLVILSSCMLRGQEALVVPERDSTYLLEMFRESLSSNDVSKNWPIWYIGSNESGHFFMQCQPVPFREQRVEILLVNSSILINDADKFNIEIPEGVKSSNDWLIQSLKSGETKRWKQIQSVDAGMLHLVRARTPIDP